MPAKVSLGVWGLRTSVFSQLWHSCWCGWAQRMRQLQILRAATLGPDTLLLTGAGQSAALLTPHLWVCGPGYSAGTWDWRLACPFSMPLFLGRLLTAIVHQGNDVVSAWGPTSTHVSTWHCVSLCPWMYLLPGTVSTCLGRLGCAFAFPCPWHASVSCCSCIYRGVMAWKWLPAVEHWMYVEVLRPCTFHKQGKNLHLNFFCKIEAYWDKHPTSFSSNIPVFCRLILCRIPSPSSPEPAALIAGLDWVHSSLMPWTSESCMPNGKSFYPIFSNLYLMFNQSFITYQPNIYHAISIYSITAKNHIFMCLCIIYLIYPSPY